MTTATPPDALPASKEAEAVAWRVTLRPDDRTIKDDLIFTFVQRAEFDTFCKGCRTNQSAWSITDICEYQAITATRALDAVANAVPGEDDDELCSDCPPVGYPTDKTRCAPCPRNAYPPTDAGVSEAHALSATSTAGNEGDRK